MAVNVVEYTLQGPVPAVSAWGLLICALLILSAATILLRRTACAPTIAAEQGHEV